MDNAQAGESVTALLFMTLKTAKVIYPDQKRTLLSMALKTAALNILTVHFKPGNQSFMVRLTKNHSYIPRSESKTHHE